MALLRKDDQLTPGKLFLCPQAGMAEGVRYIFEQCPEERQVQMYTETITKDEAERERQFLKLMHCVSRSLLNLPSSKR